MADLIADYAADTTLTNVAANYNKAAPAMNFGTVALAFAKVTGTFASGSYATDYTDGGSDFAKAIEILGRYVELYGVGTPTSDGFVIVYNSNTANKYDHANDSVGGSVTVDFDDLEDALDGISGVSSSAVTALTASGVTIA